MGTGTLTSAADNTPIPASDHNQQKNAMIEDFVPRNSSGIATTLAGSMGTSALRWLQGFMEKVFLGTLADNVSLETDNSDMIIKVAGVERARVPAAQNLIPTGKVDMYAGTADLLNGKAEVEWFICDGREASRTTYAALYAVVGNSFGNGNGTTTFNIPDMRGRFARGADDPGNGSGAAGNDPDAGTRSAMNGGGAVGNTVGSIQADQAGPHTHDASQTLAGSTAGTFGAGSGSGAGAPPATVDSNGTTETRPKNAYLNFIIKA